MTKRGVDDNNNPLPSFGPFGRSTTVPTVPAGDSLQFHSQNDFQRSSTEGAKLNPDADTFSKKVMADETLRPRLQNVRSIALNLLLCIVNLLVGCFLPALADRSRTATVYASYDGENIVEIDKRFPYAPAELIMGEALVNVVIGLIGMKCSKCEDRKFKNLLKFRPHSEMMQLTLIYCVGDIAALGAIGSGGGLLYLTVVNSRLLFAALASTMIMKQRLETFQWILLASITSCIVIFTTGHMRSSQDDTSHQGATMALFLALLKSFLSALAAVKTETCYKQTPNIWEANTLLKMQSFLVALCFRQVWGERLERCPEPLTQMHGRCIDRQGWDLWTWAVLIAEVSNGWLSVAILTRLSAIAKFVCKAACAPSLYVAYCFLGWNQFHPKLFASVLVMTISIVLYAKESIEFLWQHCCRWRFLQRVPGVRPVQSETGHSWPAAYGGLKGVKEEAP